MSVEGLAPEPTITNIEMTDITYVADQPVTYNTAVVTVEIADTISDEFSTTSWYTDMIQIPDGATLRPSSIASWLTLRVVAVSTEDEYNYIEENGVSILSTLGGEVLAYTPGWSIEDTSLTDYLSEEEQADITQYYYNALSNGEPSEYLIPFTIEIDLPEGESNPGETGFLQFYAYVFWDMEAIGAAYGVDIDTFDWGTVAGPSSTVNYIPDGDTAVVDYSLILACAERDEVLAEFEESLDDLYSMSDLTVNESIVGEGYYVIGDDGFAVPKLEELSVTVSGLWWMNIRNIVMKNSQFGTVFYPSTSEDASFFQEILDEHIIFDEALLYRRANVEAVGYTTEWELIGIYDFSTDITSGLVEGETVDSNILQFNTIPSPSSQIKMMYFDDQDAYDLSTTMHGVGYVEYKVEIAIQDRLAFYFLTVLNLLTDAREWIEEYQRHALLPCNYNTVNDRFNDFVVDYLAVPYGSYENFLSELDAAISKFVLASKILKCITVTEAPDVHTLISSKLHPDTARPSSINQVIKAYEDLQYILLTELGIIDESDDGSSLFPDLGDENYIGTVYTNFQNSSEGTSTITISKTWENAYQHSSDAVYIDWLTR